MDQALLSRPERSAHLFEQIHGILWQKILSGEILPSERLKDVELAKELGVSRTPVREAMRKMQQEGILLPLNQGGYEVRAVTSKDLQGLYLCRASLESLAARQAAELMTPETIGELTTIVEETDEALDEKDLDRVFECNSAFHNLIIEGSDNPHLKGLCDTIRKLILFYRSTLLNKVKSGNRDVNKYIGRLRERNEDHKLVLKAMSKGESRIAEEIMKEHLIGNDDDMRVE